MRLGQQYSIVIGGLVFASLLVLGTALLSEQQRYAQEIRGAAAGTLSDALERQASKHGLSLATSMAERLVTPMYHSDYRAIAHEIAETHEYPEVTSVQVLDTEGNFVHDGTASNANFGRRLDAPWARETLGQSKPVAARDLATLRVTAPVVAGGHLLGIVAVEISMAGILGDIRLEQARMDELIREQSASFMRTGVAVGLALLALSIVAAMLVASGLSGPIVEFAAHARRIGRGERLRRPRERRRDEIGDLARAFDDMAEALQSTTVSKDYFDNVLQSMADMLLVVDVDGRVVTANPSCLAELQCTEAELRGRRIESLLPELTTFLQRDTHVGPPRPNWLLLHRPGGGTIPVQVSVGPLREATEAPAGRVFVMQDVSERLAADRRIEDSLAEKEILLREIHHRVKNNLQIISSMLSLQSDRTDDEEARAVFHESEIRIRAMALVHEQLYRSGDLAHIDLGVYLETLAHQILRYFGRSDCTVRVRVEDGVREVGVDQAIPIGLVVNELVANSVEHGFADGRAGTVEIRLADFGEVRELSVKDNGVGLPPGIDVHAGDTLGLKLVRALAEQLGAHLTVVSRSGTTVRMLLPPPRRRDRKTSPSNNGDLAAA